MWIKYGENNSECLLNTDHILIMQLDEATLLATTDTGKQIAWTFDSVEIAKSLFDELQNRL